MQASLPLLYIASPYTHPSSDVMATRYAAVTEAVVRLMNAKLPLVPFSPIVYTHWLADSVKMVNDEWYTWDFEFLRRCSGMVVLALDGWQCSKGVQLEIEFCEKHDIPYMICEDIRTFVENCKTLLDRIAV